MKLLVALLIFLSASALADAPQLPPANKGTSCVEPLDIMRRAHMDFLEHQRDETVRGGIRGAKHSLIGCIDCHVARDQQGAFIDIDAPGQFCESCHAFTAVKMDCFECHAAKPAEQKARPDNNTDKRMAGAANWDKVMRMHAALLCANS